MRTRKEKLAPRKEKLPFREHAGQPREKTVPPSDDADKGRVLGGKTTTSKERQRIDLPTSRKHLSVKKNLHVASVDVQIFRNRHTHSSRHTIHKEKLALHEKKLPYDEKKKKKKLPDHKDDTSYRCHRGGCGCGSCCCKNACCCGPRGRRISAGDPAPVLVGGSAIIELQPVSTIGAPSMAFKLVPVLYHDVVYDFEYKAYVVPTGSYTISYKFMTDVDLVTQFAITTRNGVDVYKTTIGSTTKGTIRNVTVESAPITVVGDIDIGHGSIQLRLITPGVSVTAGLGLLHFERVDTSTVRPHPRVIPTVRRFPTKPKAARRLVVLPATGKVLHTHTHTRV
jgi:hypothetical protein